jgi:hypothetical protein
MRATVSFVALVLLSLLLCGRSAAQQPAPGESGAKTQTGIVLCEGTEVFLKLAQDLNSQTAKLGESVEFVLTEPVMVGDVVVADVGAHAIGAVVRSEPPDMSRHPAEMNVRMALLTAGQAKVPLRGEVNSIGGEQARMKKGTPAKAYVDADTEIENAKPPTAPDSGSAPSALGVPSRSCSEDSKGKIRLPNGKSVRLLLTQQVSSKTSRVGDKVKLQVLDDVKVGGLVVIARKAPASGTIAAVKPAGRAWRTGGIVVQLDSVTLVNQQQQPIEFSNAWRGGPTAADAIGAWGLAVGETLGLASFLLPLAPLQHGKQATLQRSTVLQAFTHGEALLDRMSIEASQPRPPEKRSGPGSVTFYFPRTHEGGIRIGRWRNDIWCGTLKLGYLSEERRFTVKLPPGRYWLGWAKKPRTVTPLDVEDGGEYYLRPSLEPWEYARSKSERRWVVVEHDIGEIEAADTQPAKPKDIPDVAKMNLAQLQAEAPTKR